MTQTPTVNNPGLEGAQTPNTPAILGMIAFSRTIAGIRYAKDADKASDMSFRLALLRMSAASVESFEKIAHLGAQNGVDALAAANQFIGTLGEFDERTRPLDWAERLLKTYLGLGILQDFAIGLADSLQEPLRSALMSELADDSLTELATAWILPLVSTDAQLAARLGLWGRRVVGEENASLQRLLATRPDLGVSPGEVLALQEVLAQGGARRMQALGLRV